MKKLLALFMVLCVSLGMVGCKDNEPVYNSNEQFDIGMWVGISDTLVTYDDDGVKVSERKLSDEEFLEKYQEIADSGINIAFPGYETMGDGGAYNKKALKAAEQVGIKHIIADAGLRSVLNNAKSDIENGKKTREQLVAQAKEIIDGYRNGEGGSALYGFMIKDEPAANLYDSLSVGAEIFYEAAPDLMFYVNLFPIIAGGAQLSGTSTNIKYAEYLGQYFNKIKTNYISYDHYPLFGTEDESNPGTFVQTSIEETFLYNMDLIKTEIKQEGANRKMWTFLQSIQFGAKNRRLVSKADAGFQAYSFLAFGGDGIEWFCYACPPPNDGATYFGNNALINRNYEKTETYGYIQSINKEIHALMPYYKNFDWKGFMLSDAYDETDNFSYLESSENLITKDKTLSGYTSEDASFAGVFEDKEGRRGYMVVNFTDPAKNVSNKVNLTFEGYKKAIVIKNGQKTVQSFKNGKLTLDMASGEGYFVIPF